MPVKLERSFRADSPIGTYWLGHCTGFRVKGFRRSGTVEEVELAVGGRVDALAVRRAGFFRSRLILVPAETVATVDPWDETVVLARGRTNGRPKRYVPPARAIVAADSLAHRSRRFGRRARQADAPVVPVPRPAPAFEPEPVEEIIWIDEPAVAEAPPVVEEAPVLEVLLVPDELPAVEEPEPEPVEALAPEPVEEPEPVALEEPEPVALEEPVAVEDPEPVAIEEAEPVVGMEPEPVADVEPPLAEVEPEPDALAAALAAALVAIDATEAEEELPVAEVTPEPEPEPEPVAIEPEPEPEPVAIEPEPFELPAVEPEPEHAVEDGELVVAAWGLSEVRSDPWESNFANGETALDLPPLVVPAPVADVEEPTRRIGLPRRTPRPAPDSAPPREPRTRSPFRRSTTPDVPPPEPVEPEESSPSLRERLVPVAIVAKRMGAGVGAGARRAGTGVGVGATRAGRGVGVGAKRAGAGVGGGATRVAARSRSAAAAMPSRVEKGRERVNPVANAAAVLSGRAARGLGIVALLALEFAARGTTYAAAAIYRLGLATRALALAAAEATRRKGPGAGRALESVVTGTGHALVHLVEALVRAGRGVLHTLWRMIPRRSPAAAWRARKGWQESRPEPVNAERRPRRTDDLPPGVRLRNPVEQALGSRVQPEDTRR